MFLNFYVGVDFRINTASDKDLATLSTYVRPNFYMVFSRLDKKPSRRKALNLKINYKF
jgi:hypothetical protein